MLDRIARTSHDLLVQRGVVPAGTRLGRYEVIRHLAAGGMAELLLARTTGVEGFERHVVVKRIHAEHSFDETYVRMFLDEARLAASLHHHHIVQVFDVGQDQGEYFFAMEYVHGEDLRKVLTYLKRNDVQTPIEHVLAIGIAVADALHYAHEMRGPGGKRLGIVHRDVSPANILVGYDGNVKVVDFGIAKAALRSHETRSGTLKGKVAYMAPEQCLGNDVDRRSDVFALGIVLWELATVRRLFKGQSDFVTMNAIVAGKVPLPSDHRPDLPEALETIILKALAPDPENRFQTAAELREALDSYAAQAGIRTSSSALAAFMKKHVGSRIEPWLDDDSIVEVLDVDFDGAPTSSPDRRPSAADLQAAETADTDADGMAVESTETLEAEEVATIARPLAEDVTKREPRSSAMPAVVAGPMSGTQMAWEPARSDAGPGRKRWMLIGGVAALVAGAGLAFVLFGMSGKATPPPAPEPAAATAPAPVTEPAAVPAPATATATATVADPATVAAPAPATAPAAVTEPAPAVKPPVPPVIHKAPPPPRRPVIVHKQPPPAIKKPAETKPVETKPVETKPAVNCNPPYYFEGDKKIFKPECV